MCEASRALLFLHCTWQQDRRDASVDRECGIFLIEKVRTDNIVSPRTPFEPSSLESFPWVTKWVISSFHPSQVFSAEQTLMELL